MNIVVVYHVQLELEPSGEVEAFGHEIVGVYKEDSKDTKAIIDEYTTKEDYFVEYMRLENL